MAQTQQAPAPENPGGFVIFMPWVTLPRSVCVGRFRFHPLRVNEIGAVIDREMTTAIESALNCYVRRNGQPIESCTIWPIHRKWMKELYEARSATVHRGPRSEFSKNWATWQHLVLAAFAYPLAVKLRLAEEGLYSPSDRELASFEACDLLLDGSWGKGWRKPPEWSTILSMAEGTRAIHAVVEST